MRRFGFRVKALAVSVMALLLMVTGMLEAQAAQSPSNRFNVVLVMDASGSMTRTDPDRLRDEAIQQFTGLLADSGNMLGGVVFTHEVAGQQELVAADGQSAKDAVTTKMSSVAPDGDTNIGLAIDTAVDMIEKSGNPDNGSVILLLSDGNTDMVDHGGKDAQKESLELKADAVQRARKDDIKIYTVCLNANGSADTSEMKQIAKATGGVFREVKEAKDLPDAYNAFYGLIFGTETVEIVDDKFPKSGQLKTEFQIPGMGVEEVNIVIFGKASDIKMLDSDGTPTDVTISKANTFTMVKLTDVRPGTWTLVTEGVPGDAVKVNMVYNTNLMIDPIIEPASGALNPVDPVTVTARLYAGDEFADGPEDFVGYEAEAEVLDGLDGKVLTTIPMNVEGDCFVATSKLDEGNYRFRVHVTGNYLDRSSEAIGPLRVMKDAESFDEKNNTAPEPVENPVEITVAIWPFRDNTTTIDLSGLATDKQDKELEYAVVNSSFMEDDYIVEGNTIKLTNYSMSKGAFTVRAQDSWGLACDIEVIVTSHNVGLMALIGIGIAAVIGGIAFCILLYIKLTKPFYGDTTAQSRVNGHYQGRMVKSPARGRRRLTAFGLEPTGLDYSKCYFQATGERYVLLKTNVPVTYQGQKVKEVRIEGSGNTVVTVAPGKDLVMHFESKMRGPARGKRR